MASSFFRSLVFRHTLIYVGLFVAMEAVVFGVLYLSTVSVYERRENEGIQADASALEVELAGLSVAEMASIVTARCTDEPGEVDEYLLADDAYEYIAGNVNKWPAGVMARPGLVDLVLGEIKQQRLELHRVRLLSLSSGHNLLVGRNLTELQEIRDLIWRAMLRTVGLTLVLGFGGGYLFSRRMSSRLDRINDTAREILGGKLQRRMPTSGNADEFDELADNLNEMLDRIEALMEGMRAVSDNVAHDLRKPISRMRSRIELTLMGPQDPEAYREALLRTIEEIDDLLAVFNALLTIAMAESGASRDFEPIDLVVVAGSTVELYEPLAEEAGLTLRLRAERPVSFTGNPHLISQTLANLIDNAIKYAPGSGTVTVSVEAREDHAAIGVADRGPGVPDSFRDKALDRFTRLEQSRSNPGSGLGLSLVRAVAQLHQGTVELADNLPGLKVTILLPYRRLGAHSRPPARPTGPLADRNPS